MVYAKTLKALRQKGLGLYTFYKRNYYRYSILIFDVAVSSACVATCPQSDAVLVRKSVLGFGA